MSMPIASTLYPRITQDVSEAVKVLKKLQYDSDRPDKDETLESVLLLASVKLHGTRADILVYNDDKIVLQSKDVFNITIANDKQGFAAAMADKTNAILDILDQYLVRWKFLNPNTLLKTQYPVLIASEWIGTNIQGDVAISQLSYRFVIIFVIINNSWVQDTLYLSIEAPSSCIYNIACGEHIHRYPLPRQHHTNPLRN